MLQYQLAFYHLAICWDLFLEGGWVNFLLNFLLMTNLQDLWIQARIPPPLDFVTTLGIFWMMWSFFEISPLLKPMLWILLMVYKLNSLAELHGNKLNVVLENLGGLCSLQ